MINDNTAARALLRDKILNGLRRAERTVGSQSPCPHARSDLRFYGLIPQLCHVFCPGGLSISLVPEGCSARHVLGSGGLQG